ncbi:hypothetical protein ACFL0I_02410 [Gemmatimonadota bacterium]
MNRALAWLTALSFAFGCAEPQTTADPIAQTWHAAAEPEIQFGGDDDPAGPLFRITGLARLRDGILVVNAGDHSVRLYSADGTLVSSLGREGFGPGEFKSPRLVKRLPGDSLIIHDGLNRRLSVVCDGKYVCAESPVATLGSVIGIAGGFALAERPRGAAGGEGQLMDSVQYLSSRLNDSSFDVILMMEGTPRQMGRVGGGGGSLPVPLTRPPSAAVAESVLVLNNGRDAVLRIFDFHGLEQPGITLPIPLEPVTESEFRDVIEDRIQGFPDQRQAAFRPLFEAMSSPAHRPVIRRILIDRTGLIWAEREHVDRDLHSWMVVDLQGRVLAEVTTPPRLTVEEIGVDYVLGVWRDPLDVEYVRMHRLSRE